MGQRSENGAIARAASSEEALEVVWREGSATRFAWLWLRDHCPCPQSLHPTTGQRMVDTFALPRDLRPASVALADDGQAVEITWAPDGHVSRYPAGFLRAVARPAGPETTRRLWDRETLEADLPEAAYQAAVGDDAGLLDCLEKIERFGLCFVRGAPADPAETRRLAERIGYLRTTIFGTFWDFTADLAHGDTAYTNLEVGLHTDGTYARDPPGLQMFHCLYFDGTGAETVLVDGFRVADDLRRTDPTAFEVLARVQVPGRYIEDGVHLLAWHQVIGLDGTGAVYRICFNNLDRAPFLPPPAECAALYDALRAFHRRLAEPGYQYRLTLRPGTVLLFDNWRVLHARTAYTGQRRLVGCYLNREDFESRLRVLRAAVSRPAGGPSPR